MCIIFQIKINGCQFSYMFNKDITNTINRKDNDTFFIWYNVVYKLVV